MRSSARMLRCLKAKAYKICVWTNTYIAQESKLFDGGIEGGFLRSGVFGSSRIGLVASRFFTVRGVARPVLTNGHRVCRLYPSRCMRVVVVISSCG
ncbi:hypothetical protein BDZ89DRAFT_466018 [Hymenopellis radicata]|nr:hypothetical protein BDZ89DRAFT_466018 [Hymenopellis radicata]